MLGKYFPRRGHVTIDTYSGRPNQDYGVNVQSGTPAHTLSSSFIEIEDSLPHNIYWIRITISETAVSGAQTDALVTLYTGTAGNEKTWIPSLLAGWSCNHGNGSTAPKMYQFPLYLPKGTRISGKSRSFIVSDEVRVALEFDSDTNRDGWYGSGVEALGINASSSQGTSITPGTTSDGTWTDIGTSTKHYGYVLPALHGGMSGIALTSGWTSADIGSSSEAIGGLEDFLFYQNSAEFVASLEAGKGRMNLIPSGTALQMRLQNGGTAVDPIDCAIYGVY